MHKYTPEYHEDTIIELETKADKLEMEVKNEEKSQKERTYLEKREVNICEMKSFITVEFSYKLLLLSLTGEKRS